MKQRLTSLWKNMDTEKMKGERNQYDEEERKKTHTQADLYIQYIYNTYIQCIAYLLKKMSVNELQQFCSCCCFALDLNLIQRFQRLSLAQSLFPPFVFVLQFLQLCSMFTRHTIYIYFMLSIIFFPAIIQLITETKYRQVNPPHFIRLSFSSSHLVFPVVHHFQKTKNIVHHLFSSCILHCFPIISCFTSK